MTASSQPSAPTKTSNADEMLKLISPLLAVAAFVWGIYTYRETTAARGG